MAKELTPEQQIEALNKQVESLKDASAKKDATIRDQKGLIESQGKQISDLKTDVAAKVEEIRNLNAEAEANETVLAQREAKLRAAEVSAEAGAPAIEHEGRHYLVVIPSFQYEGKKVTAEQLKDDATLIAELISKGSGVLRLVE